MPPVMSQVGIKHIIKNEKESSKQKEITEVRMQDIRTPLFSKTSKTQQVATQKWLLCLVGEKSTKRVWSTR